MIHLTCIYIDPLGPFVECPRWRIYGEATNKHVYVFTMFAGAEPTLEQAEEHLNKNTGEAIDLTEV
jgi:hypothetical protein